LRGGQSPADVSPWADSPSGPAIGLLIAASVTFGLARNSPTIALAHYLAVDVALGFIVAPETGRPGSPPWP